MEEKACGRILEGLSRIMAAIDALSRSIERLEESLEALASSVYVDCVVSKIGKGRIIRSGLPPSISFIIETEDKLYFVASKIISGYDDAKKLVEIIERLAMHSTDKPVEGVLATSRYKGPDSPEGVRVIIC